MFNLNVGNITKMEIADLSVLGQITSIPCTLLFNATMRNYEARYCMLVSQFLALAQSILYFIYTMQWNRKVGLSNFWFCFISDGIIGNLSASFFFIPLMSYFAEVTPKKIEGTIFAMMTGMANLSFAVISPLIGNSINDYVFANKLS